MKIQSYHNFWQKIHLAAKEKGFPVRVMFELTYRCNFSCRHCYVPQHYRREKELETKEVLFILGELAKIGCFYLGFTGGEPFMRKDILKILWYAKKKGFEVIVYSNGSLITKSIAEELSLLRPNKVDITIPAMTKAAFERITGMVGARQRVFRAIELLHKKEVNLGFKTCILKENVSEINQIQDFAYRLGALHRLDDILSPRLDGSKEPYKYRGRLRDNSEFKVKNSKLKSKIGKEVYNSKEFIPRPKTKNLFKCGVGTSQVAITPQGELKMCLMIDYPRYKIDTRVIPRGENLQGAWDKLKAFAATIQPDKNYQCGQCSLKPYCKWCPGRGWLHNRSFTSCDPEIRLKAMRTKEYARNPV